MICDILVLNNEAKPELAGRFTLDGTKLRTFSVPAYKKLMAGMLKRPNYVDRGTRTVTAQSDPKAWVASLQDNYQNSSRIVVRIR
jgi:hypothetical protein